MNHLFQSFDNGLISFYAYLSFCPGDLIWSAAQLGLGLLQISFSSLQEKPTGINITFKDTRALVSLKQEPCFYLVMLNVAEPFLNMLGPIITFSSFKALFPLRLFKSFSFLESMAKNLTESFWIKITY